MNSDPLDFTPPSAPPTAADLLAAAHEVQARLGGIGSPMLSEATAELSALTARGDTKSDDFVACTIRVNALTLHATISILIEMKKLMTGPEADGLSKLIRELRAIYERIRGGNIEAFQEIAAHFDVIRAQLNK